MYKSVIFISFMLKCWNLSFEKFFFNFLKFFIFLKKFWRTHALFVGPLIPLLWTSGDLCPGFQRQGGSLACVWPHLYSMDSSDSPLVQHLLIPHLGYPLSDLGGGTPSLPGGTPARSDEGTQGGVPPSQVWWGVPKVRSPGRDGVPPGRGTPCMGQQMEYLIHPSWYASCVHAGGLSCTCNFSLGR